MIHDPDAPVGAHCEPEEKSPSGAVAWVAKIHKLRSTDLPLVLVAPSRIQIQHRSERYRYSYFLSSAHFPVSLPEAIALFSMGHLGADGSGFTYTIWTCCHTVDHPSDMHAQERRSSHPLKERACACTCSFYLHIQRQHNEHEKA